MARVTEHSNTTEIDQPLRYAVLISGSGRTLENLARAIDSGEFEGSLVTVVSSKSGVRGLDIAREHGIPATVIDRTSHDSPESFSAAIYDAIRPYRPHLILMAGFLRRLIVQPEWEGRILNIHPALLPDMAEASGKGFYGNRVHEAVLESGATRSGATVHVVDNEYDRGPVVMTREVPVKPGDTAESLAARVFEAECELYPAAIRLYVASNWTWLLRPPFSELL
jgi:phosphoribosylglycinamide formyltransferase 1